MKFKNYAFLLLLSVSGLSFGQTYIYLPLVSKDVPDDFIVFITELYSSKELELNIEPIKPTDTVQVLDEKYVLKYIEIDSIELRFEDLQTDSEGKIIVSNPKGVSYSSYSYGTDFFVIDLYRQPKVVKYDFYTVHIGTTYYYEIIKKQ